MWFEQMHPAWQAGLREWAPWLVEQQRSLGNSNFVPAEPLVLAAFNLPPNQVRVVWLGQDPYPTPDVAIGRAFAVSPRAKIPGSLRNIFRELREDIGCERTPDQTLESWEAQGVFLLNRHLTTEVSNAGAHQGLGWDSFTDAALRVLLDQKTPLVFVLLGNSAQTILRTLESELNTYGEFVRVVSAVHPSPLSAHRGFFGSRVFSRINEELTSLGQSPIDWCR